MTTTNHNTIDLTVAGLGDVPLTYTDQGEGSPVLILHGGAGPISVGGFADLLAGSLSARVIAPVHPGFDATPRPEALHTMAGLARVYAQLIETLDLRDVTAVGNSIGGWITAELALLHSPRIARVLLADAVGLQLDEHPIVDFFALTMDQVFDLSYYEPERFRFDAARLSPQQQSAMAANLAALQTYGGTTMADPGLLGRLAAIDVPALAVWGAADRVVVPEHGRAYADAIPGARLEIIADAGHLPQLETPQRLLELVREFLGAGPRPGSTL